MSIVVRAVLSLEPGCKLYYDCPLKGESFKSDEFFDKHHGKFATFLAYSEQLVAPLDHKGRLPGRYINRERIKVQFEGEKPRELNALHFVVADKAKVTLMDSLETNQKLGDLPHPVLFYPDDIVRFVKNSDEQLSDVPRFVRAVYTNKPFVEGFMPRYKVVETEAEATVRKQQTQENSTKFEGQRISAELHGLNYWNTSGEDLELVERGNVWALYNDPSKLTFSSDEDELQFWTRDGISRFALDSSADSQSMSECILSSVREKTLEYAWSLFTYGDADIITVREYKSRPDAPDTYAVRKLHDCFAQHRDRVRSLIERIWMAQVKRDPASTSLL